MELIENLKTRFKEGNIAIRLIFILVGIHLLVVLFSFFFRIDISNWLALPSDLNTLFRRPWTIASYAFIHSLDRPFHLLGNLIMLYFSSVFFLKTFQEKNFITFYVFGMLAGALAYLIFSNLAEQSSTLIGSSAAIYSIFFAVVSYSPTYRVQLAFFNIPVRIRDIGLALLGIDLLMFFSNSNQGGIVSHFGAAAFGFFYMKAFEKGNDFLSFVGNWIERAPAKNMIKSVLKRKKKKPVSKMSDDEYSGYKFNRQKEIDRILDKISRSGYESLSKEEKAFLFKAGKES